MRPIVPERLREPKPIVRLDRWSPEIAASLKVSPMKNPALSLWLSAANRTVGWWMGQAMGHGANAVRRQQRAMLAEMTKAATGATGKPKRPRRRPATKRPVT